MQVGLWEWFALLSVDAGKSKVNLTAPWYETKTQTQVFAALCQVKRGPHEPRLFVLSMFLCSFLCA